MNSIDQIEKIKSLVDQLSATAILEGKYSYYGGMQKEIVETLPTLLHANYNTITQKKLDYLQKSLQTFIESIDLIRISQTKNLPSTDQVLANARQTFLSEYNNLSEFIIYVAVKDNLAKNFSDIIQKTIDTVDKRMESLESFFSKLSQAKKDAEKKLEEIAELRERAASATAEIAAAQFGTLYREESERSAKLARTWIITVIVVCGFITGVAIFMWFVDHYYKVSSFHASNIATRVIVFTSLFIFLSICIKNYRAAKHNEIVNRHRQYALDTFKVFVQSADGDKGIKDAVLMEVTRTIFGNVSTGYSSSDGDTESPSKIIEVVKHFTEKNK